MIYLFTFAIFFVLISLFDICNDKKKYAQLWYNIMTLWLILLSGLAYQVGADIPGYMYEYDSFSSKKIESIHDLIVFKVNRQPLWVLLEFICHTISPYFVLFKLVIAIFSNWVISRFILKHSLYPFTALLFYGLILYLNLNFNALRQLLSISVFLLGYDSLADRKWIKYFAWCLIAWLFHSSAIICFFFPLLYFIPTSKKSIVIISSILVVSVFFALQSNLAYSMTDFVLDNSELMSENYSELAERYFAGAESSEANLNGIILIAFQVLLLTFVLAVNLKLFGKDQSLMLKILILSMILVILNRLIPIVFTRFLLYFDIFYCCLLPSAVIPFCKRFTKLNLVPLVLLLVFAFFPVMNLLRENKSTGTSLIMQYSPYYSVFNPHIDPQRSIQFDAYRGNH